MNPKNWTIKNLLDTGKASFPGKKNVSLNGPKASGERQPSLRPLGPWSTLLKGVFLFTLLCSLGFFIPTTTLGEERKDPQMVTLDKALQIALEKNKDI